MTTPSGGSCTRSPLRRTIQINAPIETPTTEISICRTRTNFVFYHSLIPETGHFSNTGIKGVRFSETLIEGDDYGRTKKEVCVKGKEKRYEGGPTPKGPYARVTNSVS